MQGFVIFPIVALCIAQTMAQNQVCDAMDPGPYLGTQPTLLFTFDEATQDELSGNCSGETRFRSAVRLVGGAGEFTLTLHGIPFMDPLQYTRLMVCENTTVLVLTQAIDRDGFTSSLDDDVSYISVNLNCIPTDTGIPSKVYTSRFFINDVNDNVPMFPHDNKTAEVTIIEATPVGTVVMTLVADDKDANIEKNITYTLFSHVDLFSVCSQTGQITLKSSLDYDVMGKNKYYELVVKAEDGGPGMTHTVSTTALVHVEDSDDLAPAFVYTGCFKHRDVCAWPKYTAGLHVEKDGAIHMFPVPNEVNSQVQIEAYDRDIAIANKIVFTIASTNPPGHEGEFRVVTRSTVGNSYMASILPVEDLTLKEGFQIFLKAEERSVDKKNEIAMIYFTDNASSTSSGQSGADDMDGVTVYSDRELALITVTAILVTLALCLCIGLICAIRSRRANNHADIAMSGTTNNGFTSDRL